MKTKFYLLLFLLSSYSLFSQDIVVNGNITSSEDGFPLPGVNVVVLGTTRGVSSDFDGNYSISVSQGEVLEFSYIGFVTQNIPVGTQTTINVSMETDTQSLDEVVVIGYGTQKRADLTSAISTIDASELQKSPVAQVVQGFQGKVAGVQISSLGSPGETPEINIRGINSLYGNSAPLFVVDGMFYDDIDFLNATEIEDVSVLKE